MSFVMAWLNALLKELFVHKAKAALLFGVITLAVVGVGVVWPKQYQVNAIIFADDQNIIRPLLSGTAEVTRPDSSNQITVVRDRMLSNSLLTEALTSAAIVPKKVDEKILEQEIRKLRSAIQINDIGRDHIKISYKENNPNRAFDIVMALTNTFIKDSSQAKRRESREAYQFIDNQVKMYKEQLQTAEDRLKDFKSSHGGLSGTADARMSQVRADMSRLSLDLQVARARRNELRNQLSQENQFTARQFRSDGFRERMAQAQSQLDTLRLSYSESYPDIVSLKQQIKDLEQAIADMESKPVAEASGSGSVNPVYARLRGSLADAEVEVRTLELRLAAAEKQLREEQSYSKQGAEYEAQLAELTRDYTVTQQLYQDMLERKEKARLSVALDVEGQGVTYKIKEPPIFPTVPVGLRFMHFFLLAPILGIAIPLALLVAYIQLDPRVRFVDALEGALPETVSVLAVIPHLSTSAERNEQRGRLMYIGIFLAGVLLVYVSVGVLRVLGVA